MPETVVTDRKPEFYRLQTVKVFPKPAHYNDLKYAGIEPAMQGVVVSEGHFNVVRKTFLYHVFIKELCRTHTLEEEEITSAHRAIHTGRDSVMINLPNGVSIDIPVRDAEQLAIKILQAIEHEKDRKLKYNS